MMPPEGEIVRRTPGPGPSIPECDETYQQAPVGLCAVDRALRHLRANGAYARMVGHATDDLLGRDLREVLPEPARQEVAAALTRVIATGEPVRDLAVSGPVAGDPSQASSWLVNLEPLREGGRLVGAAAAFQDVTAIRRAEQAAREELREIESLFHTAPIGLSLMDRDLRYVRVNQAIADLNGIPVAEVVGKTYRDLSPDTADIAEPVLRTIMERAVVVRNLEVRARPPADPETEHVFLLSMEPVKSAGGEVVAHMAAVQDVTQLRRAEQIAARRLEELETLYANTPLGLCYMDAELRIVHLNPRFARLSPFPIAKLVGASAADALHEDFARQLLPRLAYAVRTGRATADIEIRGRLPGGAREYTWIAQAHPVTSREDQITGIVTVLQDVTRLADRRREAEAVRDRLAEAQAVARVGSWEWNIVDDVVWWSRELLEIFGRPESYEPTYLAFFEHVHPDDRHAVRRQIERALADEEPYRISFRIVRPDGSERLVFTAARVERSAEGTPVRLLGTCQDVTERADRPPLARWSARG
jgi:PAS domain S-box-containing protein